MYKNFSLEQYYWLIYVIACWFLAYLVYYYIRKRDLLKFNTFSIGPLYLMIKTRRLNNLFIDFTNRHKHFLNVVHYVIIISGIIIMISAFYFLLQNLIYYFLVYRGPEAPAKLLIPGVTISSDLFLKMLPGILIVVIPHELGHKIFLHKFKAKVKHVGIILLFFIPAAFVEPDEKDYEKLKPEEKMSVLSVGSCMNIFIALSLLPLIISPQTYYILISPLYSPPSGVIIEKLLPKYPLANSKLVSEGDVIVKINNVTVKSISDVYSLNIHPGDTVNVKLLKFKSHKYITVKVMAVRDPNDPNRGVIGYIPINYYPPHLTILPLYLPHYLYQILFWAFFLSLNVGLINMLPIYALDGYGFLNSLLDLIKMSEKYKKIILAVFCCFSLSLLFLNLTANLIIKLI